MSPNGLGGGGHQQRKPKPTADAGARVVRRQQQLHIPAADRPE